MLFSLCQFIQYPYEYWFDEADIERFVIEENEECTDDIDEFLAFEKYFFRNDIQSSNHQYQETTNEQQPTAMAQETALNESCLNLDENLSELSFFDSELNLEISAEIESFSQRIPLARFSETNTNFLEDTNIDEFNYFESIRDNSPLKKNANCKKSRESSS